MTLFDLRFGSRPHKTNKLTICAPPATLLFPSLSLFNRAQKVWLLHAGVTKCQLSCACIHGQCFLKDMLVYSWTVHRNAELSKDFLNHGRQNRRSDRMPIRLPFLNISRSCLFKVSKTSTSTKGKEPSPDKEPQPELRAAKREHEN